MKKHVRFGAIEISDEAIAALVLRLIGENDEHDPQNLVETPSRMVKAWGEMFSGYGQDTGKLLEKRFDAGGAYDEMIIVKDVQFYSTCEHHFLPFFGKVHIAYIPERFVLGVSKLCRVVDVFSRRLQIQERMTEQIADAIWDVQGILGVGVVVEAEHLCMKMRGVQKQTSVMVTSAIKGAIKNDARARNEFIALMRRK